MYLLTETASPFALERWAAFFANFGQFAKGFFYTLGISIGALIVALLLGLIFGAMSSTHNKVLRGISWPRPTFRPTGAKPRPTASRLTSGRNSWDWRASCPTFPAI